MAILADTGATVLVTLNALRLLRLLPAVRPAAAKAAPAHDHDHGHDHEHDHAAAPREAEDCCAHGACGSKPTNVACGACRAPNQASARYCSQCGQAMAA
jgi:Zn2+/Cd2+-exporting ATPase